MMDAMKQADPLFDEADLHNPDYRCEHDTFVGNPYGADYICGPCEDGISREEWATIVREREEREESDAWRVRLVRAVFQEPLVLETRFTTDEQEVDFWYAFGTALR